MSTCQVTPKDSDKTSKGHQDVFYIYYGGKWPNKQRLSEHRHKVYNKTPFYPNSSKHVQLPVYPNFKYAQETKKLKHMFTNEKSNFHLLIKSQVEIDEEKDQKFVANTVIRQVCSLKTIYKVRCKTPQVHFHCEWT
jgi:hypothetical protein